MPAPPKKTATIGFRAEEHFLLWHRSLKERGGYEGADLLRALYLALMSACGDDVPRYPFDLYVRVRLRDGDRYGTGTASDPRITAPKPYHLPERADARAAEDGEPLTEPTPHARRQAQQPHPDQPAHG
jgi:hypothetical protein